MTSTTPSTDSASRRQLLLAATIYTLLVVYGSLVPLHFRPISIQDAIAQFASLPYLDLGLRQRADWVANLLLFVPIGFLWTGALIGNFQSKASRRSKLPLILLACCAFALALEFTQLWFWPRTVSQNDVLAEMLGSVLGVGLSVFCGKRLVNWWRNGHRIPRVQWYLQLYLAGFVACSLFPLDFLVGPSEIYRKFVETKAHLLPTRFHLQTIEFWQYAVHVLACVPIGLFFACQSPQRGVPTTNRPRSIGRGSLFVVAIEFCQFFVYSRVADLSHVVAGVLGVMVGALLGPHMVALLAHRPTQVTAIHTSSRQRSLLVAGLALYVGCLFAFSWWPYNFHTYRIVGTDRPDYFWRAPFAAFYWGTELTAAVGILRQTLLFVPLGMLIALSVTGRRSAFLCATAASIFLGGVIECGQIFLPAHNSDVTDVLLGVLGASAGVFLIRELIAVEPGCENGPQTGQEPNQLTAPIQFSPGSLSMRGL